MEPVIDGGEILKLFEPGGQQRSGARAVSALKVMKGRGGLDQALVKRFLRGRFREPDFLEHLVAGEKLTAVEVFDPTTKFLSLFFVHAGEA